MESIRVRLCLLHISGRRGHLVATVQIVKSRSDRFEPLIRGGWKRTPGLCVYFRMRIIQIVIIRVGKKKKEKNCFSYLRSDVIHIFSSIGNMVTFLTFRYIYIFNRTNPDKIDGFQPNHCRTVKSVQYDTIVFVFFFLYVIIFNCVLR